MRNQFNARWQPNETNISAQQIEAGSNTRIPSTDGDKGRPARVETSPSKRAGEAHALIRGQSVTESKTTISHPPDNRFGSGHRLADKHDFRRVFKQSQRSRDKMFTVLFRPNDAKTPRLGFAIGKRNCRLSTGRNRLKRIVRESFRQHCDVLGGIDVVVLNQAAAAMASNRALFDSLTKHWNRCRAEKHDGAGKQ